MAQSPVIFQAVAALTFDTRGEGFLDITSTLSDWLKQHNARDGLLTVFIGHTSASLTIQENADPAVQRDLLTALERLAPKNSNYTHIQEGPDDMPSHIKSMLTSVSLSIPVVAGRMALGVWQGVYIIEHRTRSHKRRVSVHFMGSVAS